VLESRIPFLFPMGRFVTDDLLFGRLTVHCICKGFTQGRVAPNNRRMVTAINFAFTGHICLHVDRNQYSAGISVNTACLRRLREN
jgi:hypothetical protein